MALVVDIRYTDLLNYKGVFNSRVCAIIMLGI